MKALKFKIWRPQKAGWPGFHWSLGNAEGKIVEISPKGLAYDRRNAKYWFSLPAKQFNKKYGKTETFALAAWWVEQIGDKSKVLGIARRKKPFQIHCVRHFLKKQGIEYSVLNDKRRVAFVTTPDIIEKMADRADVYIVGQSSSDWIQKRKEDIEEEKKALKKDTSLDALMDHVSAPKKLGAKKKKAKKKVKKRGMSKYGVPYGKAWDGKTWAPGPRPSEPEPF